MELSPAAAPGHPHYMSGFSPVRLEKLKERLLAIPRGDLTSQEVEHGRKLLYHLYGYRLEDDNRDPALRHTEFTGLLLEAHPLAVAENWLWLTNHAC